MQIPSLYKLSNLWVKMYSYSLLELNISSIATNLWSFIGFRPTKQPMSRYGNLSLSNGMLLKLIQSYYNTLLLVRICKTLLQVLASWFNCQLLFDLSSLFFVLKSMSLSLFWTSILIALNNICVRIFGVLKITHFHHIIYNGTKNADMQERIGILVPTLLLKMK